MHAQLAPVFGRLLELGTGDGNGFDLFARELALAGLQGELLADNRAVAVSLIEQVDELVADAQLSTREATRGVLPSGVLPAARCCS